MHNIYISGLMSLRRDLDNLIDNEIENTLKGRGNSASLKESLLYRLDDTGAINGRYKAEETAFKTD